MSPRRSRSECPSGPEHHLPYKRAQCTELCLVRNFVRNGDVGFLSIPFERLRVLRWKCRQGGKTMSNLATDDIDIAIAYPYVRVQTVPVVLRRTIIKHRR